MHRVVGQALARSLRSDRAMKKGRSAGAQRNRSATSGGMCANGCAGSLWAARSLGPATNAKESKPGAVAKPEIRLTETSAKHKPKSRGPDPIRHGRL